LGKPNEGLPRKGGSKLVLSEKNTKKQNTKKVGPGKDSF